MCGSTGSTVKSIVREMNGEKVDIVRWFEDPVEQLAEALKPAVPQNVNLDRDKRRMYFEVVEDDLSVAIGRKGINARLTSRLLGWKLDIGKVVVKQVCFDERKAKAAEALTSVGIEFEDRLVAFGLVSPEAFEGVTATDQDWALSPKLLIRSLKKFQSVLLPTKRHQSKTHNLFFRTSVYL